MTPSRVHADEAAPAEQMRRFPAGRRRLCEHGALVVSLTFMRVSVRLRRPVGGRPRLSNTSLDRARHGNQSPFTQVSHTQVTTVVAPTGEGQPAS